MTSISRSARANLTLAWAVKFGLHVALLFLGLVIAYGLRRPLPPEWWTTDPDAIRVLGWAALYSSIGAVTELIFQSERAAWRFASMREVVGLVRNVTITIGVFIGVVFFLDRGMQLPRSVLPLTWLVSVALLVGFRMVWRLPHDPALAAHFLPSWWPRTPSDRKPMLIVGPMSAADRQLRVVQADPHSPYQPVGVVTPNPEEVGLRLHGVPFIASLSNWNPGGSGLTARGGTPHAIVFLEDPVQAYGFTSEKIGELRRAGHTLLKPQILTDIASPAGTTNGLHEIPLEDFLPRKPISLDPAPIRELITGRRVLVTGAGGSIGSEICRQLLALGCAHLSMVDHSEFLLFEIDRELAGMGGAVQRRPILANVRDADRVRDLVRSERPDIIFHAAALKHVALVENNPAEGVLTNVLGTWNVIEAAVANDVAQFVLISTDKAVAPSNVMGATKRIAESLLDLLPGNATRMTAVRFGNVLGSAGSVVPIFRDQIARGGPVTVTHPDVNRFFMTIPEAVQLVLHSAAIGMSEKPGVPRKFLLEMGEPVKIADLARQMILLSGKSPDTEIVINFSGLKPGEKLSEVLIDEDEVSQHRVDGINEVTRRKTSFTAASLDGVSSLIAVARGGREVDTTSVLNRILADVIGRPSTL
jgi:O-antigen biosynthesis protein WbqV